MQRYFTFISLLIFSMCPRSFSWQWDFAVTTKGKIQFYDENWFEVMSTAHQFNELSAIAFDDVELRIFFSDQQHSDGSIFAFQVPTTDGATDIKIDQLIARTSNERVEGIAYDPLDRTVYWTDSKNKVIYHVSLSANEENLTPKILLNFTDDTRPDGIAVDICRRKLYWTSSNKGNPRIERSTLSGTDREIVVQTELYRPHGIVVDQSSERIFYVVEQEGTHFTIESCKLDGTDRQILIHDLERLPMSLTVTRNSIYWTDILHQAVWMMKNDPPVSEPVKVLSHENLVRGIVSRNEIFTKLKFLKQCKSVVEGIEERLKVKNKSSVPIAQTNPTSENLCLNNGSFNEVTKTCICKVGYSGFRCQIYDCHNFCVHGTCIISEGYPSCTCQRGFEGERCEKYKCDDFCLNSGKCQVVQNDPVCECENGFSGTRCENSEATSFNITQDELFCLNHGSYNDRRKECICEESYSGERCEIYECRNYCVHGTCEIIDGFPECICQNGFYGERCQASVCSNFCFNSGRCIVQDTQPVCQCAEGFSGTRCEMNSSAVCSSRAILPIEVPGSKVICLNGGVYEKDTSSCICNPGYEGLLCEKYVCENFCVHGSCKVVDGFPHCTCQKGFEGERCHTNVCTNFCLNKGHCEIVNEEPVCRCSFDFSGKRCEKNVTEQCLPLCKVLEFDEYSSLAEMDHCIDICGNQIPLSPDIICKNSCYKALVIVTVGCVVCLALIYLIVLAIRRLHKTTRPKIKKTYVVQKSFPRKSCDQPTIEQCEITIENCCNMNICETPCFDPKIFEGSIVTETLKDDDKALMDNMEN